MNALIGYTGFVGSTLIKQFKFDELFNSKNIDDIRGKEYDTLVCCGAPGQKWLACKEPEADLQNINALISSLNEVRVNKFILISTVDVFKSPLDVDETSLVEEDGLNPYGLNRRILEKFVVEKFKDSIIVRLPGLVGPGLKKNIIYDFKHKNNVDSIDSRSIFQFYPTINLWSDISFAISNNIKLLHLTSEPISVGEVAKQAFNFEFNNEIVDIPAKYDMKSLYCDFKNSFYHYTKKEVISIIRFYNQSF
jgi:nucleoside-diphosphate-sugar epimerase